ncbi:MAG TPA: O-antigen ligase family protein [Anaerolineae bacterium]|nr:O-antigen ligase family protein [Anaerolineae bacterium]
MWLLAGFAVCVLIGIAAVLLPPVFSAALLVAGVVVLLWLFVPDAVILALLLVRSSVDGFMELFTLFSGSALSMNLSGALNSAAVGLGILTLLRRLARREPLFVAAPGRVYALFLLVGILSMAGSIDLPGSLKEWARLASGLAVYLMVASVARDERGTRRVVTVIYASSIVPLALACLQSVTGRGYFFLGFIGTEYAYRPQGTFAHPAALGSYLLILLTLAVGLIMTCSTRVRVALLAWSGAAAACLVLTLARAQWLGMMVATLVVGFLKRWWLAFLALVLAALLLAGVPLLRERLTASDSVEWRLELWQVGWSLAWPPSVLGQGVGTAHLLVNQLLPKVDSPPHNDYLKALIEMGWLGLLTFVAWLLALLRHAWKAYRSALDRVASWRALSLMAVVLAGMVISLADNYHGYTAVQWYLWAIAALVPRS